MEDEEKVMNKKDWLISIIIFALCLTFTLVSFALFYIFKPLDTKWIVLICSIDVLFSIILTFSPFMHNKNEKLTLRDVGITLLWLAIYVVVFNVVGLLILWKFSLNHVVLYWQECICFSLFIMPCYYVALPIIVLIGEAVGQA